MTDSPVVAADREDWPSRDLVEAWLGDPVDFELRPGETLTVDTELDVAAARRFRDVLGRFASGVTVVTAMSGEQPVGMTCQSFSSVSLEPPLVLFCPARTSRSWPLIEAAGTFCVNLLADGQAGVSRAMATRGADKFAGVGWDPAPETGSPLLHGVIGYVDCRVEAVHRAGDHFVVIGRVLDLGTTEVPHALTFFEGRYGSTAEGAGDRDT